MTMNTMACTIERRLLVNYRIDPDRVAAQLPQPFRPQVISGHAVGGVCFLRLGRIRPAQLPGAIGLTTENVAHRFAVEWDDDQGTQVGVYVPRRDTNSRITSWAGGLVFSGRYRQARFRVDEGRSDLRLEVASRDGQVRLSVAAHSSDTLGGELFGSLDAAIDFFRRGSLSYSPTRDVTCLDGVRLLSESWDARPVSVDHMASNLFDDTRVFPAGTCTLDSAMVMRNLPVRWQAHGSLRSESPALAR